MRTLSLLWLSAAVLSLATACGDTSQKYQAAAERFGNPHGFISVPMDHRAPRDTVLIMSAPNCPSEEGQRARYLSAQLDELRIPNVIRSQYRVTQRPIDDALAEGLKRLELVMYGEGPAVFINGMGIPNPGVDTVVAEFQRQRGI